MESARQKQANGQQILHKSFIGKFLQVNSFPSRANMPFPNRRPYREVGNPYYPPSKRMRIEVYLFAFQIS